MTRHLREDECMRIAADGDIEEPLARHLDVCQTCTQSVNDWKAFIGALRMPAVWAEPAEEQHSLNSAELVAKIRRMTAEEFGQLMNEAVSRELLLEAGIEVTHELVRRAPRDALRLADVLRDILTYAKLDLPAIAGTLAKERANALRRLMRYGEAAEALDEAELEYRRLVAPFYELAFVEWGRATLAFALRQFREARARAANAWAVFIEFGDEIAAAEVRMLEGGIAFDEGDLEEARRCFEEVASVLEQHTERPALALAYQNLCTCDLRLGALDDAQRFHALACAFLKRFDMKAEAVRLSWSVWEAFAAHGEREAALSYLCEAAADFSALGMEGDAAEVGLDILEQLIALERYDEAIPLARDIASICQREGVAVDVANAVAFLEQAVRATRATAGFVRRTRLFVEARLRGEAASIDSDVIS